MFTSFEPARNIAERVVDSILESESTSGDFQLSESKRLTLITCAELALFLGVTGEDDTWENDFSNVFSYIDDPQEAYLAENILDYLADEVAFFRLNK